MKRFFPDSYYFKKNGAIDSFNFSLKYFHSYNLCTWISYSFYSFYTSAVSTNAFRSYYPSKNTQYTTKVLSRPCCYMLLDYKEIFTNLFQSINNEIKQKNKRVLHIIK